MGHASTYRILLRKAGRDRIAIMLDSLVNNNSSGERLSGSPKPSSTAFVATIETTIDAFRINSRKICVSYC